VLRVQQLTAQKAEEILNNWLICAEKRLTDEQWSQLRLMFARVTMLLPLYLKLVYDIILNVRSYEATLDEQLLACVNTDQLIVYLLRTLERVHGTALARHALCYMTVLKSGISDAEIEDLLSLDETVLYSVFQFHLPPERRLPSVLWTRIKSDLAGYIVEREADDTKVACWYHRRFVEVATQHYVKALPDQELYATIYTNIVDMYSERWRGLKKPFELNDYLKQKYKNDKRALACEADRLLNAQPIKYVDKRGQVKYNKRKLNELPHCLANMRDLGDADAVFEQACRLVYFNYEFMHARLVTCARDIGELSEELTRLVGERHATPLHYENVLMVRELKVLRSLMLLCGACVAERPDAFAHQLVSRLLAYYYDHARWPHIAAMIDECDRLGSSHCSLVATCLQQLPPGGYLIANVNKHAEAVVQLHSLAPYLITCSANKLIVHRLEAQLNSKRLYSRVALDVKMPRCHEQVGLELEQIHRVKCICDETWTDESRQPNEDHNTTNADLFPVRFLIIRRYHVYVVLANGQTKFAYESIDKCRPILDAYCVGYRTLLIVEANSSTVKIYPDYELEPFKYYEHTLDRSTSEITGYHRPTIRKICNNSSGTCTKKPIDSLALVLLFDNNQLRYYFITLNSSTRHSEEQQQQQQHDKYISIYLIYFKILFYFIFLCNLALN
jgi:hypothetical protein